MSDILWETGSTALVPFTKIYMDENQAEHIARGHREFANLHLPIQEAIANPTRVYEAVRSHPSDGAYKRLQFVSDNVRTASGRSFLMAVVERDQDGAGKVITATWKGSVAGSVFWEAESNVFTHYDKDHDIAYISRGTPREAYAEDDSEFPSIWLRRSDEDDTPLGVTVFEFSHFWSAQKEKLVEKIAAFMSLGKDDIKIRLGGMV